MNTFTINIKPAEAAGICKKCGNFCEIMFEVTISLGAKSQMLFLCERCSKIAKSSVDKKNSEIISKEIPKTTVTNQYTKSSQKVDDYECSSESNSKKEFNIDDTSTYYLLNTAQKKIVNDYQSVIHTSLWKEGFNAVDLIRQSNVSPDDLRAKILTRLCDVAGYYWIEGPVNFSIPLDMFGYIKGKNVNEDESIYYSQRPVFTKYDNRDFGEILDTVGEALSEWKSKNLLTNTMAATTLYLRTTNESLLDKAMLLLADGAKLHHDQQNQELYDCSWTLWALVAAAVDFDNRYKKIITKHINEAINETNTVISNNVTSQENKTSSVIASDVQKLRELTGIGMMDCKNALIEANGDMNRAESILKSKESYTYKKSNSDDVQSFPKTNRENNVHPVSQNKQINNVSSSNQKQSSNSSVDNPTVYTLKERVNFFKNVLFNLPGSCEATLLLISTYTSKVFSDFAKSHQGLPGIEKVYAFLGVRGNDDEKSRYSFYSQKYNNNLEKIADDVVKLTLNGYEDGNKKDPEMTCVCFSAIALCSNPSPSVISILLKEVERIVEKGRYISPDCIDLWAVMSILTGYGDGKAPFDPVDAERFRREYVLSS